MVRRPNEKLTAIMFLHPISKLLILPLKELDKRFLFHSINNHAPRPIHKYHLMALGNCHKRLGHSPDRIRIFIKHDS